MTGSEGSGAFCRRHVTCSSIHTLRRYGDAIDPDADLSAMQSMRSFLKPDGVALLAVPVLLPAPAARSATPRSQLSAIAHLTSPLAAHTASGGCRHRGLESASHIRPPASASFDSGLVCAGDCRVRQVRQQYRDFPWIWCHLLMPPQTA
jgi:hypothetical protein